MIVSPDRAAERHFFMEELYNTNAVWVIRITVIAISLAALLIYMKYSHRK